MHTQSNRMPHTCPHCGSRIIPPSSTKFCSRDCYFAFVRAGKSTRFWSKVEKTPTCWLWTASVNERGYGKFGNGGGGNGWGLANRFAWELLIGPIPSGLLVCHHCDTPACVRADPDPLVSHLFLGTHGDNHADMVEKGRDIKGDQHWTHLSPQNIARGEALATKLTAADVLEIRSRYAAGGTPQQVLADEYGVTQTMISHIVHRIVWAHV